MKLELNNKDGRMTSNKGYSFDAHYFFSKKLLELEKNGEVIIREFKDAFFEFITGIFKLDNGTKRKLSDNKNNYVGEISSWLKFNKIIEASEDGLKWELNLEILKAISTSFEDTIAFNYIRSKKIIKEFSPKTWDVLSDKNMHMKISSNKKRLEPDSNILFQCANEFWENYNSWWKGSHKVNYLRKNDTLPKGNDIKWNGRYVMSDATGNFTNLTNYITIIDHSFKISRKFHITYIDEKNILERMLELTGNKDNVKSEMKKDNAYLSQINFDRIKMKISQYEQSEIEITNSEEEFLMKEFKSNNFELWLHREEKKKRNYFKKNLLELYTKQQIIKDPVYNKYVLDLCDGAHIYSVKKIKDKIRCIFSSYCQNEEELKNISLNKIEMIWNDKKHEIDNLLFMIADHNNGIMLDKITHHALDKTEFVKWSKSRPSLVLIDKESGIDEIDVSDLELISNNEKALEYLNMERED